MKKYYRSKEIYCEDAIIDGYLVVEDGKIVEILSVDEINVKDYVDYTDQKILPGVVDTHNHGTFGWSMLSGYTAPDRATEIKGYLRAVASQGVTSVYPTASREFFADLAEIIENGYDQGAEILGIHSEGPWLNRVGEKGKRPENPYPPVMLETAMEMVENAKGHLKMVGLAPEIPGIDAIIDYFLSQNVVIAIAHTDGNYSITKHAIEKGAKVATHMSNVMTGIHHRDFGCLGACLTDKRIWAELIADGLHVCPEMMRFITDVKGTDKVMLISDCTPLSGLKPGDYVNEALGGLIKVTKDGFVLDENGRLRGSSMPVVYGMRKLVMELRLPLEQVSRMASYNPAKCHGFLDRKGSLKVGKDADFIVFDNDLNLKDTYVCGINLYQADAGIDYFNPYFIERLNHEPR